MLQKVLEGSMNGGVFRRFLPRCLLPVLSLGVLAFAPPSSPAAGPEAFSVVGEADGSVGPETSETGRLVGIVRHGELGSPIAAAFVRLEGPEERTSVTDAEGTFRFEGLPAGTYTVRGQHLGYRAVEMEVEVAGDDQTTSIEILLRTQPIALDPLDVEVERRRPTWGPLAQAYERMEWQQRLGLGSFITREEIENRIAFRVADLLRGRFAGVRVTDGGGISMGRARSFRGCPVGVYVDGMRVGSGGLPDWISPNEVEIIEIYRGASQVPADFGGSDAMCGVVAIWTRRGF